MLQDTWLTKLNSEGVQALTNLAGVLGVYHTPKNMKRYPAGHNPGRGRNNSKAFDISRPGPNQQSSTSQAGTTAEPAKVTVDVAVSSSNPIAPGLTDGTVLASHTMCLCVFVCSFLARSIAP
jgi:hypothetical protein